MNALQKITVSLWHSCTDLLPILTDTGLSKNPWKVKKYHVCSIKVCQNIQEGIKEEIANPRLPSDEARWLYK